MKSIVSISASCPPISIKEVEHMRSALNGVWLPLLYACTVLWSYGQWHIFAPSGPITRQSQGTFVAVTTTPTSCIQDPSHPPTSAVSDLDHSIADWGIFCEGVPLWTMQQVTAPSLDDEALRCGLSGGEAYSNIHCYRDLLAEPDTTVFTYTLSFRFSPNTTCNNQDGASRIQALEFTASAWHQSQRYEFALQWQNVGAGGPQWRYWDPHQSSGNKWVPFSPAITSCLTGTVWHTLTLIGDRRNSHVHYQAFIIDSQRYEMDITLDPYPTAAHDHLAVAVQLDGNYAEMPYDLFIDQVSLVRGVAPPTQETTPTATTSATVIPPVTSTSPSAITPTLPVMTPISTSVATASPLRTTPPLLPRVYVPLILRTPE